MVKTHADTFEILPARNHTRWVVFVNGKAFAQFKSAGRARACVLDLKLKGYK